MRAEAEHRSEIGSCHRAQYRMVQILGGEFERGRYVRLLQVGVILKDFFAGCPRCEQVQHIFYSDSRLPNAGTPPADIGSCRDSVQFTCHDFYLGGLLVVIIRREINPGIHGAVHDAQPSPALI